MCNIPRPRTDDQAVSQSGSYCSATQQCTKRPLLLSFLSSSHPAHFSLLSTLSSFRVFSLFFYSLACFIPTLASQSHTTSYSERLICCQGWPCFHVGFTQAGSSLDRWLAELLSIFRAEADVFLLLFVSLEAIAALPASHSSRLVETRIRQQHISLKALARHRSTARGHATVALCWDQVSGLGKRFAFRSSLYLLCLSSRDSTDLFSSSSTSKGQAVVDEAGT